MGEFLLMLAGDFLDHVLGWRAVLVWLLTAVVCGAAWYLGPSWALYACIPLGLFGFVLGVRVQLGEWSTAMARLKG